MFNGGEIRFSFVRTSKHAGNTITIKVPTTAEETLHWVNHIVPVFFCASLQMLGIHKGAPVGRGLREQSERPWLAECSRVIAATRGVLNK